jgi:hypothetical protein
MAPSDQSLAELIRAGLDATGDAGHGAFPDAFIARNPHRAADRSWPNSRSDDARRVTGNVGTGLDETEPAVGSLPIRRR